VRTWLQKIRENSPPGTPCILVGNKRDLKERRVTQEEGRDLAFKEKLFFVETSATDNENVAGTFFFLTGYLLSAL
jgi:GTPase SAR1 family protein